MLNTGHKLYERALREASKEHPSYEKAFKLLSEASKAGNNEATYALGTWYLHGRLVEKNIRKALQLIRQSAEAGVPSAVYDLAASYEMGTGVRKSPVRAAELYVQAALLGDKQAVYEVGRCYYHGIGIQKDRRIARIWLNRARQLGVKD